MRGLLTAANLTDRFTLDSAGTGGWHVGEPPDPRTCAAASRAGYDLDDLRARQFRAVDFARFDLIIAMDRSNLATLERLRGSSTTPPIHLVRSFDPTAPKNAEVPDPYGGNTRDFDEVVEICERACRGLLQHLLNS